MKIENLKIENLLRHLLSALLFLLPWQTIWIYQERYLNGVKWEYGTLGFYATEGLLWLCAVLFMIWYWNKFRAKFSNFQIFKFSFSSDRIFLISMLLLIIYQLSSTLWSTDAQIALQQSLRVIEAAILFLVILIGPLSFERAAKWFIAGAVIQALLGIWQFLTQSNFSSTLLGLSAHPAWQAGSSIVGNEAGRWLRAYGGFPHPNILGGYLVIALAALLPKKLSFIIYHLSFSIIAVALFFTFSRSAWIALVATLFIALVVNWKKYFPIATISLVIFFILSIIYWPLVATRLARITQNEIQSTNERITGYSEAISIWKKHTWLGVGAGNYTLVLHQLQPNRPGWEYQPVHNAAVLFLTEMGIIGTTIFSLFLFSFFLFTKSIGIRTTNLFILILPFLPIIFLDHYSYSSLIGLLMTAIYSGLLIRKMKSQSVPALSTLYPRQHIV